MAKLKVGDVVIDIISSYRVWYDNGRIWNVYVTFACIECGKNKTIGKRHLLKLKCLLCKFCEQINRNRFTSEEQKINRILDEATRTAQYNAKTRKLDFSLSRENIRNLIFLNCTYCDTSPNKTFNRKADPIDILYIGIDRIDSSIGYTKQNCVACCSDCNHAKWEMSDTQFLVWLDRIARFQGYVKVEHEEETREAITNC